MPGLTIRDDLPNLQVETNHGKMKLHDYVGDSYTILFSHPGDFTPSHNEWIKDIEAYNKVTYPIIADLKRELIKQLNMVDPDEKDSSGNKLPSRVLHIVGPDKKVILNASTGRDKVATPANWKPGEPVVIAPGVSNEEAKEMFSQGFDTANLPSGKCYLRFTKV
ncbi:hypothetical protein MTR67_043379 [Solanum verrucosum]|uniref:thioredoxin-dependent peroxiredoxin n=1 Tax=Solanum verrucosum TaxID=315347 RepID=A0AAF0URL8_SOLVR|nr:hypothetical protein MTR67_043379 [Solanum verrucosum]